MYIVLSSAATPRYRQDILRCLAAPLGATVQFRYAKKYVANDVLQEIEGRPDNAAPLGEGIVCFIDGQPAGVSPLFPVRKILIEAVVNHGSTISLTLRMQGFAFAEAPAFTKAVDAASKNASPRKNEEGKLSGKFFFAVPSSQRGPAIEGLSVDETIAQWERIVEYLQGTATFADEPFFWTVLGLGMPSQKSPRDERFRIWEEKLQPNVYRCLLIYHYRPQSGGELPDAGLTVKVGGPVESASPEEIGLDSRYDLKRWFFRTDARDQSTHYGWIRIRSNKTWDLDLPAILPGSPFGLIAKVFGAGIFIAAPAIISLIDRHADEIVWTLGGQPHMGLWVKCLLSLISGWVAAWLVLCGVPRVRS